MEFHHVLLTLIDPSISRRVVRRARRGWFVLGELPVLRESQSRPPAGTSCPPRWRPFHAPQSATRHAKATARRVVGTLHVPSTNRQLSRAADDFQLRERSLRGAPSAC